MAKLSKVQREVLGDLAGGKTIRHFDLCGDEVWSWTNTFTRIPVRTANALADCGLIAPDSPTKLVSTYRISDSGRSALAGEYHMTKTQITILSKLFDMIGTSAEWNVPKTHIATYDKLAARGLVESKPSLLPGRTAYRLTDAGFDALVGE